MQIKYRNWNWQESGAIELGEIFNTPLRKDLIARVIRWQRAKSRSGNHSTKTLAEVAGSNKKVWGQKETGRARQGERTNPHFRGGGVVFGPHPRSYEHKLNKKLRRLASISTLSNKLEYKQLHIIENFDVPFEKTSKMAQWLKEREMKSVLFVCKNGVTPELKKYVSNIPYCDIIPVCGLNVLDMVKHKEIICDVESIKEIEARFAKKEKVTQ